MLLLFFAFVFLMSIRPLRDFDLWFHIKSGEIIAHMGLIHYDVFSYTAYGREWFPYEWLFQVSMFAIQQVTGFDSIKYVIAFFVLIQFVFLYLLFRKILKLPLLLSLFTCFFFYASIYDFIVARPHIVAYTFLVVNLFFIFLFYFKNKNLLWITLPITYMWGNMHGSIFLDVFFFGAYAVLCFCNFFILKDVLWKKKGIILGIFTLATGILSIFPPLGITQYRLLWMFFLNQKTISTYIDEWTPLAAKPDSFIFYTATVILIAILFVIIARHYIKKKRLTHLFWILPILPLIIIAYNANRNVYLGNFALSILLAFSLKHIAQHFTNWSKRKKAILFAIILIFIGFYAWVIQQKMFENPLYYPVKAVNFLRQYHLSGHMFNEYGYGGYLLYQLYPQYKVFIDGRTDVYLCCELPTTLDVSLKKNLPDKKFQAYLYKNVWDRYDISFVMLRTEKNTLLRKITRLLNIDSQWSLVFWDDYTQIFVRKNGKNDAIIKKFEAKYATPYLQDPYIAGKQQQAMAEYLRMDAIAKSAHTSNAIGYILLQEGKIDEAKQRFEEAIALNPQDESPYMNLGEIAAYNGQFVQAIELYKQAQKLAPDRGLIYIRLGQLYMQGFSDTDKARKAWQFGLDETIDGNAIKQLKQFLSTLN